LVEGLTLVISLRAAVIEYYEGIVLKNLTQCSSSIPTTGVATNQK